MPVSGSSLSFPAGGGCLRNHAKHATAHAMVAARLINSLIPERLLAVDASRVDPQQDGGAVSGPAGDFGGRDAHALRLRGDTQRADNLDYLSIIGLYLDVIANRSPSACHPGRGVLRLVRVGPIELERGCEEVS